MDGFGGERNVPFPSSSVGSVALPGGLVFVCFLFCLSQFSFNLFLKECGTRCMLESEMNFVL